jgi:23S rRNA (uracil-5-)-methyltransferase RumA
MAHSTTGGRSKRARVRLEAELTLRDWGPKATTTSEVSGKRVLVDRGIPGERVLASVFRGREPLQGSVAKVLEPSPERIAPPCPHYLKGCGGCQIQHVAYSAQIRMKQRLINQEMAAAGLSCSVDRVWTMRSPWQYRRTAAIALGWEAGFRPRGRRGIVAIHDCRISHPLIGAFCDRLNMLLAAGRLPNYHAKAWLDCTVVDSRDAPALQVVVQAITGLTLETHPELGQVAATLAAMDGVGSVAYRHRSGEVRPIIGDLMGTIRLAGRSLCVPAGSFCQTNLEMTAALLSRARTLLEGRKIGAAADIYGGIGTLGLSLANLVGSMSIIELDPRALEAARRTAGAWGLSHVRFVEGHAEQLVASAGKLDLAIVDPPRSGLGDAVIAALIGYKIPLVLYVSCAPTSLARDLAKFRQGGYAVKSVELFDFYPQTYHVESLAVLEG